VSLPSHARQATMSPARRSKHRTTHRGRACPFKAGQLEARLVFCSGGPGGKASSAVAVRVQGTVWAAKASRSETKRTACSHSKIESELNSRVGNPHVE
jgi:hypothetical protein